MKSLYCFLCRTKNDTDLLNYQYVEPLIDIVSQDRDYSNVDVHEHAILHFSMLSIKTAEERGSKNRAENKEN